MNDLINGKNLLAGGVLITFWSNIKALCSSIVSIFWRSDYVEGELSRSVVQIILKNSKVYKWGNKKHALENIWTKKQGKRINVIASAYDNYYCLYDNKIPLILTIGAFGNEPEYQWITVNYFAFLFTIDRVLEISQKEFIEIDAKYDRMADDIFFLTYVNGGSSEKPAKTSNGRGNPGGLLSAGEAPALRGSGGANTGYINFLQENADYYGFDYKAEMFPDTAFKNNKKAYYKTTTYDDFKEEILFWRTNREWYEDREIPWKRGCLLKGKHGTGKSRLVREICQEISIPLTVCNISGMQSPEFESAFANAASAGKRKNGMVFLIEDIDVVFNGRTNILQGNLHEQLLTFDTLINTLSGVKDSSGVFIVVTTNHMETLDPALFRPGRLDRHLEIGGLCEEGRYFIASKILNGYQEEIDSAVSEGIDMVASEFENFCIEKAIHLLNSRVRLEHSGTICG